MRDPAGRTLVLEHAGHRAEVVTVGAGLRSLTAEGVDLVAGYPAGTICPDYRGWVLMPWPNRVGAGRYEFRGTSHQLPLTEVDRGNALHGLVGWVPWTVTAHTGRQAVLTYELPPQDGYPFALDLRVEYELGDGGLTVGLQATNAGAGPAPYGVGFHPYLTLGRRADDLELTLPAGTWCAMDDRGLPGPPEPVDGTPYDFREARRIGDLELDHPFGDLTSGSATLRDPIGGRAVTLTPGEGCAWLHVFTCDPHDPPRRAVAVEPMSCPPDAFRSGTDLAVLEPGATHRLTFTLGGGAPA